MLLVAPHPPQKKKKKWFSPCCFSKPPNNGCPHKNHSFIRRFGLPWVSRRGCVSNRHKSLPYLRCNFGPGKSVDSIYGFIPGFDYDSAFDTRGRSRQQLNGTRRLVLLFAHHPRPRVTWMCENRGTLELVMLSLFFLSLNPPFEK